jgi:hypothetical protein
MGIKLKKLKIITWVLSICLSFGCSNQQLNLTQQERLMLGNIGLVPIRHIPEFDIDTPAKGMLEGSFRKGVRWGVQCLGGGILGASNVSYGQEGGAAAVIILGLVSAVAVVGGLTGSVVGAFQANPSKVVEMQNREIMLVLAGEQLQDKFRSNLMLSAQSIIENQLLLIQSPPCISADDISPEELTKQGIGTKMTATITYVGLKGDWDIDPDLAIKIKSKVILRKIGSSKNLYDQEFTYLGKSRKFSDWANNHGSELVDEINNGLLHLSDEVTKSLFH